ncbi:MAG: hypothetical protein Q8Q81_00180 [Oxalobacteraceae bacterium]|nr:hypothetical protein [Oxalobacteraceae bacterium]
MRWHSGRSLVATAHADTELGRVVQGCGVVVAPGDAGAFAAAIRELARDPVRRQELGGAGRGHAELHLGIDRILSRFERVLLGIV